MARKTGDINEQNNDERKKNIAKKVKKPVNKAKRKIQKKETKINRNKPLHSRTSIPAIKQKYITHTGEKLSTLQGKFVDLYIELGNQRQAVIQAGYKVKNPDTQANQLLRIPKIADEINWRLEDLHKSKVASAEEIMEFYTKVMRGEEKDQFGLDAPLSERIKAGNELAKRKIDIPNKMEANLTRAGMGQATVTIALDWGGMENDTDQSEDTTDQ